MTAARLSILLLSALCADARVSEVWDRKTTEATGIVWRGNSSATSSHDMLLASEDLPSDFNWCEHPDGNNYCTMSRNQHIPQYCGSCWAHGALSALGDRIKIARKAKGIDINLSVQHMLNCGTAGSCHGGSIDGPYQWIHQISKSGTGISYETANPYLACSSESTDGICPHADWSCTPMNVARTCSTFPPRGKCVGLSRYPNATVSDYGSIEGAAAMEKEIFARGPIACGIDASPIEKYTGGVVSEHGFMVDHVISVTGWGTDPVDGPYWIVRNSWGEYWGDMGYIKVAKGKNALRMESQCAWAVPGSFTTEAFLCYEDGSNCEAADSTLI